MILLKHMDAMDFVKEIETESVNCIICDPPFGISEDMFDKHYARDKSFVMKGYQTAPSSNQDYYEWVCKWIHEFPRILKKDGTAYIVCAWNHLCDIENAIRSSEKLEVVNHIIWKYNFGVYTKNKFVTSHYHILRVVIKGGKPFFNNLAYFDEKEKTNTGHSAQYADMEDVWFIQKEYAQGEKKNINKLPNALVEKMLKYSTKYGDVVCDLFMGNFTTAYVSIQLGRKVIGCEINEEACKEHIPLIEKLKFPEMNEIPQSKTTKKPKNAGKKITEDEMKKIETRYNELTGTKKSKIETLEKEFDRGHFSIVNILKKLGH